MENKIILKIPIELKEKLEKKIKETDFKSIQDYILYFLKQVVSDESSINSKKEQIYTEKEEAAFHTNQPYDGGEEAALKKKLTEMGYL